MQPQTSVVLLGGSLLGRFTKPRIALLESMIGPGATAYNCAAGGWNSADGARRAPALGAIRPDVVVLSFGMNDCAPWKRVPLDEFVDNLGRILAAFPDSQRVGFLPPAVREYDRPGLGRRTNAELDRYRAALRSAVGLEDCLDVTNLLADVTFPVLEDDGIHLSDESYTELIPHLGRLIARRLSNRMAP